VRLAFLIAVSLALAVACGGSEAIEPSPSAAPTATRTARPTRPASPTPTPAPTLEPTPEPTLIPAPTIDVSASHARQGGFLLVRLVNPPTGLGEASVQFNGGSYTMLPSGDRWFAVIGLSTRFAIGDHPIEVAAAGTPLASGVLTVGDGGFEFVSIELPPSSIDLLSDQVAINAERATLAQVYAGFTPERRWSGAWILPAPGVVTNEFGLMRSINGGAYFPHTGTDIANEKGTAVAAAASGVVTLARPMYLYGNVVVIDHGAGVFTSYNHLNSIAVSEGRVITIGDLVGFMGETGFVSGPHLHWEAIIGGVRTDPTFWTLAPVEP